jgi:hypothetical protein
MLLNFFLGGLIGLIYYLIICQISHNLYLVKPTPLSTQRSILFLYFGGLIGLFLGYNMNNKTSNSGLRIGLYFGSSLLVFNSMLINWEYMSNETKLLLLGINFGLIIWYSYYKVNLNKKKEKKKLKSSS